MNYRIFFTLFPKGYWVLIVAGIVLHFSPNTADIGNTFINFGVFLIAVKVAVITHEAGHLLAAKAVGGLPRRVVLGKGHQLYQTKISGVRVAIHSDFRGGHAYASIDQPRFQKLRYGFYIFGGVFLNMIIACSIYVLFDLSLKSPEGKILVAIPLAVFLANAGMVLNLIPFNMTILGMKVPSDGLALLKLPFTKKKEIKERLDITMLYDGYEYLENKDYQSALTLFTDFLRKYPDTKILSMNIAYILLKTGQTEKGLEEGQKLLAYIDDKLVKPYSAMIYNQLAWFHLLLNNIVQADDFSELAMKATRKEQHIRGTRGCVLIEKGQIDPGISLLLQNMDFKFVNNVTLAAAMYLTLGYHLSGDTAESRKYLEFVKTNRETLDTDEKILFERILSKIGQKDLAD